MSEAAGHNHVIAQLPLIALGDEDTSIVRVSTSEGMFVNLRRRPVVIAIPIFGLERIQATWKMNGSGGRVAA